MTAYAVSKGALETLTQQWAFESPRKYACTVNCVRVGATKTEESAGSMDPVRLAARQKVIERTTAAARLGEIDDVAQVVGWLAGDGSRWVNGQVVNCNGGVIFN
jgi:3-oxoacyl-[acyl-carrier protein] reductase